MIFILSVNIHTGYGVHPAAHLVSIGVLYQVYSGLGVLLTTHLHPMSRLKMSGATPPTTHTRLHSGKWVNCTFIHRHSTGWQYGRRVPATDYYHETQCIVE